MRERPLRRIFLLQPLLAALIPLFIALPVGYFWIVPQVVGDVEYRQSQLARAVALQVEGYLQNSMALVKGVGALILDEPLTLRPHQHQIDAQVAASGALSAIYTVDYSGRVQGVALAERHRPRRQDLQNADLSLTPVFRNCKPGDPPRWSDSFLSLVNSGLTAAYLVPTPTGVVIGESDLGQMTKFLQKISPGDETLIMVIDRGGQVIADQVGSHTAVQLNISNLRPVRAALAGKGPAFADFEFEGRRMTGTIVEVPSMGWHVLVAGSVESVYRSQISTIKTIATALVAAVLLSMAGLYYLARRLSRYFEEVAGHAGKIAAGEWEISWPTGPVAEINLFSSALRHMAETLHEQEEALRHSERRLSTAINATQDAIWEWNLKTGEMYYSSAWYAMLGYEEETGPISFENWKARCHPDDLQQTIDQISAALSSSGRGYRVEYRMRHRNGSWVWILGRGKAVEHDSSGSPVRASGTCTDVTERKTAEEMSRSNEARLESLLRIAQYDFHSTQDLLDHGLNEAILLTQSKVGFLCYYDEELKQFIINSWSKEVMEECALIDRPLVYLLEETGIWGEAVRRRSPLIVNDYLAPHPSKKGYPKGHVALHSFMCIPVFKRDAIVAVVTVANKEGEYTDADVRQLTLMMDVVWKMMEQVRSDQALLAAEAQYRNLLESIELIAVMLDTSGQITFCNDFLLDLTGWRREEVLGRNWFELFIPAQLREKVAGILATILAEGSAGNFESALLTRQGKERLVSWNNTILHGADGTVIGVAFLGSDLTERRHLEDQLRQAQKIESIGQLAGGVAHDFNNILTVIMGYAGVLSAGTLDPRAKNCVHQILDASDKAAQLTRGLLAFSRKQPMVVKKEDLNAIVQKVQTFLVRIIGEDIQFKSIVKDVRLPVSVDAAQIEQVLMNLATNARDAMPRGGRLVIETGIEEIAPLSESGQCKDAASPHACITISDTGVGMDEETRSRIFEPFFTTKEVGKGTGLGLSIVYGIVKQHGGVINVYSERGVGTTFRIYLPLAEAMESRRQHVEEDVFPQGGTETILLAEDDPGVRELVESILTESGYQVVQAVDGQDAIEKFLSHRDTIGLVVMDMIMPRKSGKEAYDEISRIKPGVKVLYSSGYTADFIQNRGVSDEGIELIMKPVRPGELLRKVRQMLDA